MVDVDRPEALASLFALGLDELCRRTTVVKTGRGYHVYAATDGPTAAGKLPGGAGELLALSSDGLPGLVVAPPTLHPSGARYRFLSDVSRGLNVARLDDLEPTFAVPSLLGDVNTGGNGIGESEVVHARARVDPLLRDAEDILTRGLVDLDAVRIALIADARHQAPKYKARVLPILDESGEPDDRSSAEYCLALSMMRQRLDDATILAFLIANGPKAKARRDEYVLTTVQRARASFIATGGRVGGSSNGLSKRLQVRPPSDLRDALGVTLNVVGMPTSMFVRYALEKGLSGGLDGGPLMVAARLPPATGPDKVTVRLPEWLHDALTTKAAREGVSVADLMVAFLRRALGVTLEPSSEVDSMPVQHPTATPARDPPKKPVRAPASRLPRPTTDPYADTLRKREGLRARARANARQVPPWPEVARAPCTRSGRSDRRCGRCPTCRAVARARFVHGLSQEIASSTFDATHFCLDLDPATRALPAPVQRALLDNMLSRLGEELAAAHGVRSLAWSRVRTSGGWLRLHVIADRDLAQMWVQALWTWLGGGRVVDLWTLDPREAPETIRGLVACTVAGLDEEGSFGVIVATPSEPPETDTAVSDENGTV